MRTDEETEDMTKLIVAFRDFAKMIKNCGIKLNTAIL